MAWRVWLGNSEVWMIHALCQCWWWYNDWWWHAHSLCTLMQTLHDDDVYLQRLMIWWLACTESWYTITSLLSKGLACTCQDLDVWWLDSNQQCWWAAWPAVLMFNMTMMTWAERWCGSDIYRDDLTVTRVQRLSRADFGMWQVHRFDNLLLIRVAGRGKEMSQ